MQHCDVIINEWPNDYININASLYFSNSLPQYL